MPVPLGDSQRRDTSCVPPSLLRQVTYLELNRWCARDKSNGIAFLDNHPIILTRPKITQSIQSNICQRSRPCADISLLRRSYGGLYRGLWLRWHGLIMVSPSNHWINTATALTARTTAFDCNNASSRWPWCSNHAVQLKVTSIISKATRKKCNVRVTSFVVMRSTAEWLPNAHRSVLALSTALAGVSRFGGLTRLSCCVYHTKPVKETNIRGLKLRTNVSNCQPSCHSRSAGFYSRVPHS